MCSSSSQKLGSAVPSIPPWTYSHTEVDEIRVYKECVRVLSKIIFYLLQDGYGLEQALPH